MGADVMAVSSLERGGWGLSPILFDSIMKLPIFRSFF